MYYVTLMFDLDPNDYGEDCNTVADAEAIVKAMVKGNTDMPYLEDVDISVSEERDLRPLPIGTIYDNQEIVEVVDYDASDPEMPYKYRLTNGGHVWIELKDYPDLLKGLGI